MLKRFKILLGAIGMTLLIVLTSGIFLEGLSFIAIRRGVDLLETLNVVPPLWGATHAGPELVVSLVVIAPIVGAIAWKMFRRALWVERELTGDRFPNSG